ncbi:hypothetical protein C8Q80DRAFT_610743 [Daedaleopsis nitida]|nr:hypothetical protein C8Q80DRAFT_610743 [Daedaleopsis nitida]
MTRLNYARQHSVLQRSRICEYRHCPSTHWNQDRPLAHSREGHSIVPTRLAQAILDPILSHVRHHACRLGQIRTPIAHSPSPYIKPEQRASPQVVRGRLLPLLVPWRAANLPSMAQRYGWVHHPPRRAPFPPALASALDRVSLLAVMRTGALGGFVTHIALVWTFSLLVGCCIFCCGDGEPPREMTEAERRAMEAQIREEELERRSKRTPCSWLRERLVGAAISLGRAAGAAALGAVLLHRMSPAPPMSAGYASLTSVVGAAVLYVPRTAMWCCWRTIDAREQAVARARSVSVSKASPGVTMRSADTAS